MLADNTQTEQKNIAPKSLIIGLDFGAAFTKVVIGDKHVRYAIPFVGFAQQENPYLLPSILATGENNNCLLAATRQAQTCTDNLKIPLLDNTCTKQDMLRISAYLALVFRYSRDWLLTRYKERYSHVKIAWSINAGLPADDTDNPELSALYKKLIHTAWVISVLPGPITLNRVRQFMESDDSAFNAFPAVYKSKIIDKSQINTFPGCIAQICGYVHSKKCRDDLHMLIDIGASTINIATFNTAAKKDDNASNKCALFSCTFEPIGVAYLLSRRYENLQLAENDINLFKDIPDTHSFSQAHDLTDKDIKFADTLYSGDVSRMINKILDLTKTQYYSNSSRWDSGVQTFTCGGGAHMEIIQDIVHSFEHKKPPHKIKSIRLKMPDDLKIENSAENTVNQSFDRLSVAYGLSFESGKIGKAVREASTAALSESTEA